MFVFSSFSLFKESTLVSGPWLGEGEELHLRRKGAPPAPRGSPGRRTTQGYRRKKEAERERRGKKGKKEKERQERGFTFSFRLPPSFYSFFLSLSLLLFLCLSLVPSSFLVPKPRRLESAQVARLPPSAGVEPAGLATEPYFDLSDMG